jgi:hypothetical protein
MPLLPPTPGSPPRAWFSADFDLTRLNCAHLGHDDNDLYKGPEELDFCHELADPVINLLLAFFHGDSRVVPRLQSREFRKKLV